MVCSLMFLQPNRSLAQTIDSVSLSKIISDVIQNHPSIKQAEEGLKMAEAKINLAKSSFFPDISFNGSYTRLGPVPELTFPGLGTFEFYPANNFNAAINVHENIWDFGRTTGNIKVEKINKELTSQGIEQTRQKMAIAAISNYYTLVYLQQAINIKNEQKKTLEEHLEWVKKKQETGSAIEYEILTIQVKISNIASQLLDLEAAQTIQQSVLNSLLGQSENTVHLLKNELDIIPPAINADSLVSFAFNNRFEMQIEKDKDILSKLRLKLVQTQRLPVLDFIASGGFKNGFIPELNKMTANYAVGLGLKVPIFEGTRTKYNLVQAKTMIQSNSFETEATRRTISNEVIENETNMKTALKKIDQFRLQFSQAQKAHQLAEINFKAGAITNLDLLDATTSVSESSLYLLKAKIDYVVNIFKLKAVLGMRLY